TFTLYLPWTPASTAADRAGFTVALARASHVAAHAARARAWHRAPQWRAAALSHDGDTAADPPTVRDSAVLPTLEHPSTAAIAGSKILVVDDDFRNIFALSALLERFELDVISAESGEQGIAVLEQNPDVDLVLVDIMMPGMDGYATMRAM